MEYEKSENLRPRDQDPSKEIPVAELGPSMVKVHSGDSTVWIDARKMTQSTPRWPALATEQVEAIKRIKCDLYDVFPISFEDWEYRFRCDQNPQTQINVWRWIAWQYKKLSRMPNSTTAHKRDYFQLCLKWTITRDVDEAVACANLEILNVAQATELLRSLPFTPAGYFGGSFGQQFPQLPVFDYRAITSIEDSKERFGPATLIFAVNRDDGDAQIVFGGKQLEEAAARKEPVHLNIAAIGVDFDTNETESLLAMVCTLKGEVEWNGETISLEDLKRRFS